MGRRSGKESGGLLGGQTLGPTLAEKLMDTGNLVLGGLVLAQFLGDKAFDWRLAGAGGALWLFCFALASWLLYSRRGGN
jgi:hypothetical protein